MVEPHSSNFRMITTNVLGVRIFRKFTVVLIFEKLIKSSLFPIYLFITVGKSKYKHFHGQLHKPSDHKF